MRRWAPAMRRANEGYSGALGEGDPARFDWTPMWCGILEDLAAGVDAPLIAARFHVGLAETLAGAAASLARKHGSRPSCCAAACSRTSFCSKLRARRSPRTAWKCSPLPFSRRRWRDFARADGDCGGAAATASREIRQHPHDRRPGMRLGAYPGPLQTEASFTIPERRRCSPHGAKPGHPGKRILATRGCAATFIICG